MKPLLLEMENIGSYKNKTVIDFEKFCTGGLFLINGDTGSGKTTIFDAVCMALFNKVSGDKEPKSIIGDLDNEVKKGKPKKGSIVFEFMLRGERFRIEKNLSLSEKGVFNSNGVFYKLTENGCEDLMLNKKSKNITSEVTERLGVDFDNFRQIAMLAQGKFREFLSSDDSKMRDILRNIFSTEKYESFVTAIGKKIKDLDDACKRVNEEISAGFKTAVLNDEERKYFESVFDDDEKTAVITAAISRLDDEEKSITKQIEKNNEEIVAWTAEKERANENNRKLKNKNNLLNQMQKLFKTEDEMKLLCGNIDVAKKAGIVMGYINEYEKAVKGLDERKRKLEDLKNALPKIEEELEKKLAVNSEKKKNTKKIAELNVELEAVKSTYAKLEKLAAIRKSLKDEKLSLSKKQASADLLRKKSEENNQKIKQLEEINSGIGNYENEILVVDNNIKLILSDIENLNSINAKFAEYNKNDRDYNVLAQKYIKAKKKFAENDEELSVKKASLKLYENEFWDNQAGILAEKLEDNKPCPVCGMVALNRDRQPAQKKDGVKSKEEIDNIKKEVEDFGIRVEKLKADMQKASENASVALNTKMINVADITKDLKALFPGDDFGEDDFSFAEKKTDNIIGEKRNECELLEIKKKSYIKNKETYEKNVKIKEELAEENIKNDALLKSCENEISELEKNIAVLEESEKNNIPENNKISTVKEAESEEKRISDNIKAFTIEMNEADRAYNACNTKLENHKTSIENAKIEISSAEKEEYERKTELSTSISENGFENVDAAKKAFADLGYLISNNGATEKIENYKKSLALYQSAEKEIKELNITAEVDTSVFDKKTAENKNKNFDLESRKKQVFNAVNTNTNIIEKIAKLKERIAEMDKEFSVIKRIKNFNYRDFEKYVQAYYLDKILLKANRRLLAMTGDNFLLHRPDSGTEGKKNKSLKLWIHDVSTNSDRSAETLSGGESFMAALALALGMSDEIQMSKANVNIETVFVDEGFGSLDNESVVQAVKMLMDIANDDNRVIGIISHVSELKNMIDRKIVVTKKADGSHICFD